MSGPSQGTQGRAAPRRAATILVLRAATGPGAPPEVMLVRRSRQASFFADAYVFPGGRVDEEDRRAGEDDALAARRAAARELFEEVGLRLSAPADLVPLSRWITPSAEPKRFDTDFFLCRLPDGQTPATDEKEVFDLLWLGPGAALERAAAGTLKLPPPTLANLEDVDDLVRAITGQRAAAPGAQDPPDVIDDLLALCRARRTDIVLPKLVPDPARGGIAVVFPWAADYADLPGEGLPYLAGPGQKGTHTSRVVLTGEGRWLALR